MSFVAVFAPPRCDGNIYVMNGKILRFVLKTQANPMTVFGLFCPKGQQVLNRTEWRGKTAMAAKRR
jgi:hypothetical protein